MTPSNSAEAAASVNTTFADLPLADFLKETIRTIGYEAPTPIQASAIPLAVEGRDVIGLAQTGTGKTAAFVLPILNALSGSKEKGVRALILAPTRELAEQINDVIKLFAPRTGLKSCTVYGGVSHRNQVTALRSSPAIVVACPGRLKDHMQGRTIDLSGVSVLVLDEADRMLDMGFLPDIKQIVRAIPAERQTLLFSATMPDEIEALSRDILRNPEVIRVRTEAPVATVSHSMYSLKSEEKLDHLRVWLSANPGALTVVFTKMKHTAKKISEKLSAKGIDATSLHGNLSQGARARALGGFKDGKFRVLIATDIAARGIDVDGITHVLNYDMPDTLDAYIHRTGRAGRASRSGEAVSFVTRADMGMLRSIERWLKAPVSRLNTAAFAEELAAVGSEQQASEGADESRQEERRAKRGSFGGRAEGRSQGRRAGGRPDFRGGQRGFGRAPRESREGAPRRSGEVREDGAQQPDRQERFEGERSRSFGRSPRGERGDRGGFRGQGRFGGRGGRSFGERRPAARDGEAAPLREGQEQGGRDERRPRYDRDSRGGRPGSGERTGRFSRGSGREGRSPRGERPFRGGGAPRGPGRRDGDGAGKREFRGQQDIDPNSPHVYRPAGSHFIERSEGRPSGRPGRGRFGGAGGRGRAGAGRGPRGAGFRSDRPRGGRAPRTPHYD